MDNNSIYLTTLDSSINFLASNLGEYTSNNKTVILNVRHNEKTLSDYCKELKTDETNAIIYLITKLYFSFFTAIICNDIINKYQSFENISQIDKSRFRIIEYLVDILASIDQQAPKKDNENSDNYYINFIKFELQKGGTFIKEQSLLIIKIILLYDQITKSLLYQRFYLDIMFLSKSIIINDNLISNTEKEQLKIFSDFFEVPGEGGFYNLNILTENLTQNVQTSDSSGSDLPSKSDIEDIKNELDSLIGLTEIKQEIKMLESYMIIQKKRIEMGLATSSVTLHFVFSGNPGTGKTTIARILGNLFKFIGVLEKGHVVETDRSGLVGGYLGQTAIKTKEKINEALGGTLFIDEAYTLARHETSNDSYGQEAIDTIVKSMEDHREKLIIIIAGYPVLIHNFIKSNPGLESRFTRYLDFRDYDPSELCCIFQKLLKKYDYKLEISALYLIQKFFNYSYLNRDNSFGNARFVRNLFEATIQRQAMRIREKNPNKEDLQSITIDDITDDKFQSFLKSDFDKEKLDICDTCKMKCEYFKK